MPLGVNTSPELASEISRLYRAKLTTRQVAAQVGLSKSGVLLVLRRRGEIISSGQSRMRSLHDYDLTPVMEVLDGELLGDGAYAWSSSKNSARFDMTVAKTNEAHVELLHGILSKQMPLKLAPSTGWYLWKGQKIISDRMRMTSLFSSSLANQKLRWYPDGKKKQAPDDLVLTPTVLRHWYYGDGSMCSGIMLCSERYTDDVLEGLRAKLRAPGFETKRYLAHGRRGRLHMGMKDSRRFLEFIGPCELDCYRHKWII